MVVLSTHFILAEPTDYHDISYKELQGTPIHKLIKFVNDKVTGRSIDEISANIKKILC